MRTEFTQWLNENSTRKYPFTDDSVFLDDSSLVTIPLDMFKDLSMTVSDNILPVKLTAIQVVSTSVVKVLFSYGVSMATSGITLNVAPQIRTNVVVDTGDNWSAYVQLVTGAGLLAVAQWPVGTYTFSNMTVEPSAVLIDANRGVVQFTDLLVPGTPIAGSVSFIPGVNMDVIVGLLNNEVNLIAGIGNGTGQGVAPSPGTCAGLIFEINGARPDNRGNLSLVGANNIAIRNEPAVNTCFIGLNLEDHLCQTSPVGNMKQ
jgi:hypothetical protein